MSEFEWKLQELLKEYRDKMKADYNRVLPTGELLFDRFEKAKYLNAGEKTSIYDSSIIMGDVDIGSDVWIGPYTLIEGINGHVSIGNFVSINSGVFIFSHDSTRYYVSGGKNKFDTGEISIGNNTVIGSHSIVTYNVHIGNHCVIAANSFVNSDIPDCSIAAGAPAKIIGTVTIEHDGTVSFEYKH